MLRKCEVDSCMGGWTSSVAEYIIQPLLWKRIIHLYLCHGTPCEENSICQFHWQWLCDQWNTELVCTPSKVKNFWMLLSPLALSPMSWGLGGQLKASRMSKWRQCTKQNCSQRRAADDIATWTRNTSHPNVGLLHYLSYLEKADWSITHHWTYLIQTQGMTSIAWLSCTVRMEAPGHSSFVIQGAPGMLEI